MKIAFIGLGAMGGPMAEKLPVPPGTTVAFGLARGDTVSVTAGVRR